ncbi:MAG: hypothetical protein HZC36_06240 [Armatimonadetes bacterium]|nr:hypothetical protein [Armatimonadota bacterium]
MRIFTEAAGLGRRLFEAFVGLICLGFVAFILLAYLSARPHSHNRISCISNLKQLGLANLMYAADWDDRLPPRDIWMDAIRDYHKNYGGERCGEVTAKYADRKDLYGYSFNSRLSGFKTGVLDWEATQNRPMLYDSINLARNASDPFASLPDPPRHGELVNMVCFLDSHTKGLKKEAAKSVGP